METKKYMRCVAEMPNATKSKKIATIILCVVLTLGLLPVMHAAAVNEYTELQLGEIIKQEFPAGESVEYMFYPKESGTHIITYAYSSKIRTSSISFEEIINETDDESTAEESSSGTETPSPILYPPSGGTYSSYDKYNCHEQMFGCNSESGYLITITNNSSVSDEICLSILQGNDQDEQVMLWAAKRNIPESDETISLDGLQTVKIGSGELVYFNLNDVDADTLTITYKCTNQNIYPSIWSRIYYINEKASASSTSNDSLPLTYNDMSYHNVRYAKLRIGSSYEDSPFVLELENIGVSPVEVSFILTEGYNPYYDILSDDATSPTDANNSSDGESSTDANSSSDGESSTDDGDSSGNTATTASSSSSRSRRSSASSSGTHRGESAATNSSSSNTSSSGTTYVSTSSSSGGGGSSSSSSSGDIAGSGKSKAEYKSLGKGNAAYVSSYANMKSKSVTVPNTVKVNGKKYKVTTISKDAFFGFDNLKSVSIGSNVKSIKAGAFSDNEKLTSVTVKSKNLTAKSIKGCFKGTSVKVVKVPKNMTEKYSKIFTKRNTQSKSKIKVSAMK